MALEQGTETASLRNLALRKIIEELANSTDQAKIQNHPLERYLIQKFNDIVNLPHIDKEFNIAIHTLNTAKNKPRENISQTSWEAIQAEICGNPTQYRSRLNSEKISMANKACMTLPFDEYHQYAVEIKKHTFLDQYPNQRTILANI